MDSEEQKVLVAFTAKDINTLNQLLDVALKAGGRNVINAFMLIDNKLKEAVELRMKEEQKASPVE